MPGAPQNYLAVIGEVEPRAPETVNSKIATGQIEVMARELRLLNEAKTPPFMIEDDADVTEVLRLKYRYLDLRRPKMQRLLELRHRVTRIATRLRGRGATWRLGAGRGMRRPTPCCPARRWSGSRCEA